MKTERTDRELLERAAKAIGFVPGNEVGQYAWHPHLDGLVRLNADESITAWKPLTDDGDALRLAVQLHMSIVITTMGVSARCESTPWRWADELCAAGSDYAAATRLAIVRAAAEGAP